MDNRDKGEDNKTQGFENKLPGLLHRYKNADFELQLRARFLYYLIFSMIGCVVFTLAYSLFLNLRTEVFVEGFFFNTLFPQIILLLIIFSSLILLAKGHYTVSINILLNAVLAAAWSIMWMRSEDAFKRLDTIVIILGALSILPLIVRGHRWIFTLYIGLNFLTLILFFVVNRQQFEIPDSTIIEYICDVTVALVFMGIVGNSINNIFSRTINKAHFDFNEKLVAEREKHESEGKYHALMDSMNEVIIVADNNHVVEYVNKKFTEKLGYTPEEVIGKVGYRFLHDEEDYEIVEKANSNRIGDRSTVYELPFRAKDGRKMMFLVSGAPYRNFKGEVVGSIGAMTDITDKHKTDRELRESRQQFKTLAEMSPVGIFRTRADGYTSYVNPKWCEISGLSFDEALGDGWIRAVHPDDRDGVERKWDNDAPLSGKSTASYRFLKPDGTVSWVLGNAEPEVLDGELKGYIGTITDITQLKAAQKELEESESRYRAIIEAFPDILLISDAEGKIHYMNEIGQRVTGITPEFFSNPTAVARIHPDDMAYVARETLELLNSDKERSGIVENRFIDATGNVHWFSGIMSKIVMNGQTMLQTITRDVTEKKSIEQELEKYRNHLEQLVHDRTLELSTANSKLKSTNDELDLQRLELLAAYNNLQEAQQKLVQAEKMASLGVLAAGVAHEINNPLNFIKGGAYALDEFVKTHMQAYTGEVTPLIEGIHTGVKRAAEIVTSLNLYSRRDDLPPTECNLHSIIDSCLVMLHNELKYRIEVKKSYTEDPVIVSGSEGRLHQVFLNVLTNAIHAIEDKGIITIFTASRDKRCIVSVTDDGCGISSDLITRVTDPFFTTKDPGKGTGLGLSITYNILKDHGGTIDFESEQGKGTTVTITLPAINRERNG